jgi:hypothetical protein
MNKKEALQILAIMQAAYPNFYKGTKEEALGTVSVWCMQFHNMPAEIVLMAVHKLIGTNKFPPTVSEVKAKLVSIGYEADNLLNMHRLCNTNLSPNEIKKLEWISANTNKYQMSNASEPSLMQMLEQPRQLQLEG